MLPLGWGIAPARILLGMIGNTNAIVESARPAVSAPALAPRRAADWREAPSTSSVGASPIRSR